MADTGRIKIKAYKHMRASDTDLLVLTYYAHHQLSPENNWLMKIDSERYASVTL